MKVIRTLFLTLSLLICGTAHATPIDIESLFIDTASVTIDFGWTSITPRGGSFSPVEITMGEYQDSIVDISGPNGGYITVFSTDAYGMPAPSGTVDGSSIDVDLSSLRLDAHFLSSDIELQPFSTPFDSGLYDTSTGEFELIWTNQIGYGQFSADIIVSLSGYLTTVSAVPVPAAVWLFGSGLLALVGFARRRVA